MFNQPLKYKLVQVNRRRVSDSCLQEFVFKFFHSGYRTNKNSISGELKHVRINRRKIIVQIKQYSTRLFRIDFYATTSNKHRKIVNHQLSIYRSLTGLGNAHRIASTIFAMIAELKKQFPDMSYAFEAATLYEEADDRNNRRFRAYSEMLRLVTGSENSQWCAFGYPENSFIFVLQKRYLSDKDQILKDYGYIFKKTFETKSETAI